MLNIRKATTLTGLIFRKMANAGVTSLYRQSSDMSAFQEVFAKCENVVVLTGAGISAESGVPTFRGAGGLWRKYRAMDLASPDAFEADPSLVWELYHYRRELCLQKEPNKGHIALAEAERHFLEKGRDLVVITQNVDELHRRAGTKELIEMHGSLYSTRCTRCKNVEKNYNSPICQALAGRGAPEPNAISDKIPTDKLPSCEKEDCKGLLRPHIVWFGESLWEDVLSKIDEKLRKCDMLLIVGSSAVVYPAAGYAQLASQLGIPVAEFNLERTANTHLSNFYFEGPSGDTLPRALAAVTK